MLLSRQVLTIGLGNTSAQNSCQDLHTVRVTLRARPTQHLRTGDPGPEKLYTLSVTLSLNPTVTPSTLLKP